MDIHKMKKAVVVLTKIINTLKKIQRMNFSWEVNMSLDKAIMHLIAARDDMQEYIEDR